MSPVREHYNPIITQLLRKHDRLPHENATERKNLQRKILFLMTTIKMEEFEDSYA